VTASDSGRDVTVRGDVSFAIVTRGDARGRSAAFQTDVRAHPGPRTRPVVSPGRSARRETELRSCYDPLRRKRGRGGFHICGSDWGSKRLVPHSRNWA